MLKTIAEYWSQQEDHAESGPRFCMTFLYPSRGSFAPGGGGNGGGPGISGGNPVLNTVIEQIEKQEQQIQNKEYMYILHIYCIYVHCMI